jgi:hypothetical protein
MCNHQEEIRETYWSRVAVQILANFGRALVHHSVQNVIGIGVEVFQRVGGLQALELMCVQRPDLVGLDKC